MKTWGIPIKLVEDHDEAYYFWKRSGLSGRPLVHLDAHIDFNFHPAKPVRQTFEEAKSKEDLIRQMSTNLFYKELKLGEKALTNIGNYIYPGMRDGIVSDFYWVIPGDRREFNRSVKSLRNIAKSFFPRDPLEQRGIKRTRGMLKARIYGRDFIFTTIEDLPRNIDGALLDIDTDYLTTDTIRKAGSSQDAGRRFPWIWPKDLVQKLREKSLNPSCVTIAYSVNGGFTPIIYKFLGDEVSLFLNGADRRSQELISAKNEAIKLFNKEKFGQATLALERLLKDLRTASLSAPLKAKLKAHIYFILFRAYARLNKAGRARRCYAMSVRLNGKYRVRDNNYGLLYLSGKKDLKKAESEFRLLLSADDKNTHALSGLAELAAIRRDYKTAGSLYKRAYAADKKNRDAVLGLGSSELLLKNYKLALKYLKLLDLKKKPQGRAHFLLAQAYEGLGMPDKALDEYRLAHRFSSGTDLYLYLRLFKFLKNKVLSQEAHDWLDKRIGSYEEYKKAFLRQDKKTVTKGGRIARKSTERLLLRIDKALSYVK